MDYTRIRYMKEWISQLPPGNISYKTINGKRYPYYQWTENGKQRSRIVKADEFDELSEKIEQRKSLEKKIREAPEINIMPEIIEDNFYFSMVKTGQELIEFTEPVRNYKKRECYKVLKEYVYGDSSDRVFVLYGLRRTGKTTLIRQLIREMDDEMIRKSAFMQVVSGIDIAKINIDIHQLKKQGFKYLFIDEITLMDDFIECAAVFPDVYATSGMKIVLSGTDSLGFVFSEDRELYDRCYMLHTTFVPYREFENVLGITGIDQYIKFGGTMSKGGVDYNHSGMTFATRKSAEEYVDSAIANNIQHSLKNYGNGEHFRNLFELYEAGKLTGAINRIVEDINHRFTIEVLTRDFFSNDLELTAKNLLKDRREPDEILYSIDRNIINQKLKSMLEIRNLPEQKVEINDLHINEIKEYLDMLDLTVDLTTMYLEGVRKVRRTAVTQPGLRYAQAEALVKALMEDEVFSSLSLAERNKITKRIMSDIMGRMLEDIILLETQFAFPEKEVFKLVFATGEFDMVIFDPDAASCSIYEIKHSREMVKDQYRHLVDEGKCKATEFRFGPIMNKAVIYRGDPGELEGIEYLNVEEYLKGLCAKNIP